MKLADEDMPHYVCQWALRGLGTVIALIRDAVNEPDRVGWDNLEKLRTAEIEISRIIDRECHKVGMTPEVFRDQCKPV